MTIKDNHLFCFGYGYSCEYLSRVLFADGHWQISGTTRDFDRRRDLRAAGIQGHILDTNVPLADPLYIMRDVTHILISSPPSNDGDPIFNMHAQDILNLPKLRWVGYLSTTGTYGDRSGGWVDENSAVRPSTKRGSRRLKAEKQWMSLYENYKIPVHIFRLAGIYGPGRCAIDSVRAGVARRIHKPGHAFSRIHVDDLVQVLFASMNAPDAGNVYNVCDDHPAPSHEVIAYACELLGIEAPELLSYDSVDLAPITRSFYADNKRVNNDKMKNKLKISLKYPDFRSGLDACYRSEEERSDAVPSIVRV